MTEFERILQQCLRDLEGGAASVEECLRRYPQYAGQLEPVLLTSAYLAHGREARLSPAFKRRVRNRLLQQMYARPRKPARSGFALMQLATGLAVVLLAFLIAGTAYAQRALPGQAFYIWKLASENAWRSVSPDPIGTDLAIAQRRVDEMIAVRHDPALYTDVLRAYVEVTNRLRSEMNAETEAFILSVLEVQIEKLKQSGILPEQPAQTIVPPLEGSTVTPATTPLPTLMSPQVIPSELPQVVPTVKNVPTTEIVPEVLPTLPNPPKIVPTIEIPPPIP